MCVVSRASRENARAAYRPASGDADRAALLESAIPKVVAAHVAAANGNGKSDPSTYVDQTPAT